VWKVPDEALTNPMKIDADLRAAINAAAKAQKEPSQDELDAAEQTAISALVSMKEHKDAVKKARDLRKKFAKLNKQTDAIHAEMNSFLTPLGLRFEDAEESDRLEISYGSSKERFVKSGGKLPTPRRQKWRAEEAITELAAADPDDRFAILKKYGINWI
jgi:hypothetical protein